MRINKQKPLKHQTPESDVVIPIHYEGWWHFKQSASALKNEIAHSGFNEKYLWLSSSVEVELNGRAWQCYFIV
jgi:hypothetical protein